MKNLFRSGLPASILSTIFFLYSFHSASAQICGVNAGVDQTICVSQPLILSGTLGNANNSAVSWTKLSGPSAVISNPDSLITTVIGITPGNYVFQFSTMCSDGIIAKDIISVSVLPEPISAQAGPDTTICFNAPIQLSGNEPPFPFTGKWTVSPSGGSFYPNANAANAVFISDSKAGVKRFTWTITNGICSVSDLKKVTIVHPEVNVDAGKDSVISCKGKCIVLYASYPGYAPPQSGLWTLISGPNEPVFSNVTKPNSKLCNLIPGVYILKWSIQGPCLTASDTVKLTVENTLTPPASLGDQVYNNYCEDPVVTMQVITGAPLGPGETALWEHVGNDSTITFSPNRNQSSVLLGNLTGTFPYKFTYTHTAASGCSIKTLHTVYRSQPITGLTEPDDIQLPCDTTSTEFVIYLNRLRTISNSVTRKAIFISGPADTGKISYKSVVDRNLTKDTWYVKDLHTAGTYIYRLEYSNACGTQYRDIEITVSRTPGTVNAGSDIILPCQQLSVRPIGSVNHPGIFNWSQISGPTTATISGETTLNPVIEDLSEGIYYFRLSNFGGPACASRSEDMRIIVTIAPPLVATTGADAAICAGNYRLSANSPLPTETGLWSVSPSAGVSFYPSPHHPNAFVSGLSPNSVYTFTWTVSNVCGSVSSSQVLTTGAFYSSSIPNGGADRCETEGTTSILLQGNSEPGIQVRWTALTAGSQVTDPDSVVTQALFSGGSGTYHFTYEMSSPGCTALIDTVSITINSLTYVHAGADISICTDVLPSSTVLSVNLSNPTAASTGTWAQLSGPTTSQFSSYTELTPTVSGLMEGIYRFTYTLNSSTSCPSISDTVEVRVSIMPSQADAGADQSICNASTSTILNLSANTPTNGTGYWQVVSAPPGSSTPDLSDYNSPTTTIRNLTQGEYLLRWSVSNGVYCDASVDDLILSISSEAYVGEDFNACNVSSINLVGNSNTSGTWEMISGNAGSILITNAPNTAIASGLQTTGDSAVYLFKYSIPATGHCPASYDELKFTNYAPPSLADGGEDRILCSNQTSILLTGNIPVNGSSIWKFISGPNVPTAGIANQYSYDSLLTNLVAGIYEMEYQTKSHPVCPVSSETILLLKETRAKTQANFRLCNDSIIHLNGNVPILTEGTWSLLSAPAGSNPVFDNVHNPLTFVSGATVGSYTFRWSIPGTGPCPGTHNDLNVIIDPPVDAPLAGSDTTFCQGSIQSLQLGGQANPGVSYVWSPATMLDNPFSAQPNFTGIDNSGNYYYSVKASIGSCEAFSNVSVRVFPKPFVNIVIGDGGCAAIFEASNPGNGVNVAGYHWNFGTGVVPEAATGKGPHHVVYPTSGRRDVTLEILSDEGCHNDTAIEFIPLCVLPVKLVSFYTVWKAADAEISWEIEDAINLHHFEIERSFNGRDFSKIATVAHINNQSNYTFLDYRIRNRGTNIFYRLKSLDADGTYKYSPIRMLENDHSSGITIGPNPFHQFIKVYFSKNVFEGKVTASLFNAEGKRIQVKEALSTGLSGEIIFDKLLGLPPGMYMVVIMTNEKRRTFKIIKK